MERQGKLPLTSLVTYCHQLSHALAYLEAVKIIHRFDSHACFTNSKSYYSAWYNMQNLSYLFSF